MRPQQNLERMLITVGQTDKLIKRGKSGGGFQRTATCMLGVLYPPTAGICISRRSKSLQMFNHLNWERLKLSMELEQQASKGPP